MIVDFCSIFTLPSTCACELHITSKCHTNQTTPAQLWRHINLWKWGPWRRKSYSGCVLSDALVWYIPVHGWVITTSGLRKQTAAISTFYSRFTVWPHTSLWHAAVLIPQNFVVDMWRFTPTLLAFTENPTWRRPPP